MVGAHSIWAYVVVFILLIAVINAISGLIKDREFTPKDFRIGLFTIIATHTQLLIGIIAYIIGKWYSGLGEMSNKGIRLIVLEHPLMMIIAMALITIGWSKHKKKVVSKDKFKMFVIFYGLGMILVLSRIPWSNWFSN